MAQIYIYIIKLVTKAANSNIGGGGGYRGLPGINVKGKHHRKMKMFA